MTGVENNMSRYLPLSTLLAGTLLIIACAHDQVMVIRSPHLLVTFACSDSDTERRPLETLAINAGFEVLAGVDKTDMVGWWSGVVVCVPTTVTVEDRATVDKLISGLKSAGYNPVVWHVESSESDVEMIVGAQPRGKSSWALY